MSNGLLTIFSALSGIVRGALLIDDLDDLDDQAPSPSGGADDDKDIRSLTHREGLRELPPVPGGGWR